MNYSYYFKNNLSKKQLQKLENELKKRHFRSTIGSIVARYNSAYIRINLKTKTYGCQHAAYMGESKYKGEDSTLVTSTAVMNYFFLNNNNNTNNNIKSKYVMTINKMPT